ncbi:ABC transporter [Baekduia alba]|uniref:ABC transporter ATP-binding protein n=1 Tax=Baekduia alba TaxID=2997333 RepID=UPI002340B914|nr:ATP-binding cassette domain-containing protein [Baekduia alba]WCB91866.1 ABC transporter [Baekduia alba]
MTADPAPIEFDGLVKRFGRRTVLDDLSFTVPAGSVVGLLGPNGAGKSTAMRVLLGLQRPTAGRARILGHGDDHVGSFSLSMRHRVGIALTLAADPSIVVLDEPTNGLDPEGAVDVRNIVRSLPRRSRTWRPRTSSAHRRSSAASASARPASSMASSLRARRPTTRPSSRARWPSTASGGGIALAMVFTLAFDGLVSFIPGAAHYTFGQLGADLSNNIGGTGETENGLAVSALGVSAWWVVIVLPGWVRFLRGDLK